MSFDSMFGSSSNAPTTATTRKTFSAFYTDELGTAVKQAAIAQCPDGLSMRLAAMEEVEAVVEAWNQGIDSHLEAITSRSFFSHGFRGADVRIHPEEVHVLVRRLLESEIDESSSLAINICDCLDIELI